MTVRTFPRGIRDHLNSRRGGRFVGDGSQSVLFCVLLNYKSGAPKLFGGIIRVCHEDIFRMLSFHGELHILRVARGHDAASLPADDHLFMFQFQQRLIDGHHGDIEPAHQSTHGRHVVDRLRLQRLVLQILFDLHIFRCRHGVVLSVVLTTVLVRH